MPVAAALLVLWGAAVPAAPSPPPLPTAAPRAILVAPEAVPAPPKSPTEAVAPGISATLTPERMRLLLGSVPEVAVTLEVAGPDATSLRPVRAFATVGELELPKPTDRPGAFKGRYRPPAERFPQVALLVVELAGSGRRVLASARISLEGSTVVPFRSSPGAAVTVRIGSHLFGPVVADRQGRVDVPVEVPPGVRTGLARAVDHNASARETDVDLQLPPFPRVALVAPPTIEAGSFAEIAVLAVEPDGAPAAVAAVGLSASDGLVHPLGAGSAGEARFILEAPRRIGPGPIVLSASVPGSPPGTLELRLPIGPARASQLVVTPSSRRLIIGAAETATITIAARDAFGNLTSSVGARARVDGEPRPINFGPDGVGVLTVAAPGRFSGRDRLDVEAELGSLSGADTIRLTGGAPARLTMAIRDKRLVGDGQSSTELHVQAVDGNGTPTSVPGLSWDTPDGRIRHVRVPRDGEYIAEYVPDRARDRHQETVAVMASRELRADASLEVVPAPVRLVAAARAGVYTNFGRLTGESVFLEALRPVDVRRFRFQAGLTAGYLHGELGAAGLATEATTLDIDQVAVLALARGRIALPLRLEGAADLGAGFAWAATRITVPGEAPVDGRAAAPAVGGGAEVGLPLKPGRLVIGLRYLWIELGKTTHGDVIAGNAVGLIGDIGYKMTF